jgi:IS5 family transposase
MRPKQREAEPQEDLFRAQLETLVNRRHPPVRQAGLIGWERFKTEFEALYTGGGRPALPTRLMVDLHLLKHSNGLVGRGGLRAPPGQPVWSSPVGVGLRY